MKWFRKRSSRARTDTSAKQRASRGMRKPKWWRREPPQSFGHASRAKRQWSLDDPLLRLSPNDLLDVRTAVAGVAILGATSSGKSSAVGDVIQRAYLTANFGGIVFTVKPGERPLWERLCAETGRSGDLLVFGPEDSPLRFDFLSYEASRPGRGAGLTETLVGYLSDIAQITERGVSNAGSGGGGENGPFWKLTTQSLTRNAIDLCLIATGTVSVSLLQEIILSAPTSAEQIRSREWRVTSTCFHLMGEAAKKVKTPRQEHDLKVVMDYFGLEFVQLSEKTRSIIVTTFCAMADLLGRGLLHTLFSSGTTITPEAAQEGKIILIDLPLKTYGLTGLIAQTIWKQSFQRSIERRDVRASSRPVFMWLDEAGHFVGQGDMLFQTTARSSSCATVMIAQSIGTFRSAFGDGDRGRSEAAALLGNLTTKFFCANGDPETNEWASSLAGKHKELFLNASNSYQPSDTFGMLTGLGGGPQSSAGMSEHMEWEIQPSLFSRLRTGGPANDRCVDTIAIRNGGVFNQTGKVWMPVTFRQQP